MDRETASSVIESLLLVVDEPLTLARLVDLFDGELDRKTIRELMEQLLETYRGRTLQLIELADGYKLCTRPQYGEWIKKFFREERRRTLSQAALETLAIIAYRQPITKPEIEEIRGVDVSGVLKNLLEKSLIKIVGRKDVVGRPMVYGTTQKFMEHFGLKALSDLPPLEEFQQILGEESDS
jgi:segregation and condensation protein B